VGLGYLSLERQSRTLSGGEAQRVSLTAALGTALTGALFVLDEPTVGLHPTDVEALSGALVELASRGNVALVLEHDPAVIRRCGRVLELGPGAGPLGGTLCFDGTPSELAQRMDLPTGRVLAQAGRAPKRTPRVGQGHLLVRGARANNLQGLDVRLPLGTLCVITGPSGSGKSTLLEDVLHRTLARGLGERDVEAPGPVDAVEGAEAISRVVLVDQAPLGRTSRGNAATYTKAWDALRRAFAETPDAVVRGLSASHFSFNVEGGRCEACAGEGAETVEMQFLADVRLTCPSCRGQRFKEEVLAVRLRERSVAEVLELSVADALALFKDVKSVTRALKPLVRLGLGYLPLGQPLSTLSGGEAQRVKLARALSGPQEGALYLLDEPSAGLHGEDVAQVLSALHALVDTGASVIAVEHDLGFIKGCDYVVDLGPAGGRHGGRLVAEGTPEALAEAEGRTAEALRAARRPALAAPRPEAPPPLPAAIEVEHAREHNLKDVSCRIPLGKLVVMTGPSGSGKSTLAFDVVFAEAQRRFVETLSPYARQFLPMLPRPDVERIRGLPPAVALEQRTSRAGATSTVATVTEVAHYLRLLYAKVGTPHCPVDGTPIAPESSEALFARAARGTKHLSLQAPVVRARKGSYLDVFAAAARAGITEAVVDGVRVLTDAPPRLKKTQEHDVDLVLWTGRAESLPRGAFEQALRFGKGLVRLVGSGQETLLSCARSCPECGLALPELDPRFFSFNTKQGACEGCAGTGLEGGPEAEETGDTGPCPECEGTRLKPLPRAVRLFGVRYHEVLAASVNQALLRVRKWRFSGPAAQLGDTALGELLRRLEFLERVGLGYLPLHRNASTLSGGEMQRLRLAAQAGAGLTGALYVLDEPTIGLHPRDTGRLLDNLRTLVRTGSTVLVVEHDADTLRAADHLIDLGPTGGRGGGRIVAEGPPAHVLSLASSPTGRALARPLPPPAARPAATAWLELRGARAHNLKGVDFRLPLGRLTVVAGVSGSGKSTLVRHVLLPAVRAALGRVTTPAGPFTALSGVSGLRRVLAVDQSPIGRTPRSVPATFLGVWDELRRLFASTSEARARGFSATRFSFNATAGGRCQACAGQGSISHEMSFLPDVTTPCEACGGMRFDAATREVRYRGLHVGEVLHLTVEEAQEVFSALPRVSAPLQCLVELGVGYLQLGQGSHTLSGGEAQRLKLAAELTASARHEATLYVLDEPTTGLHLSDVDRLVRFLGRLVDRGDTLAVIEHHPAVIAAADYVVELGPEGGEAGGRIVAEGTPAQVARKDTATGHVLRALLGTARAARSA
jgi:excinuclease ABC subunit A